MIEAPYSKHNKTSFILYFALCLGAAAVFAYDGYLSQYPWSHRRTFFEAHTKTILFRAGAELQKALDGGSVPQELRLRFTEAKAPLSEAAAVSVEQAGRNWVIADRAKRYSLTKEADELAVYKMGPDETMLFNRISPLFFAAGAVMLALRFWLRKDTKLVAGENELILANGQKIPYDAIDSIDKTYFDGKGFFTVVYKEDDKKKKREKTKPEKTKPEEMKRKKLSDRDYDNLGPILDHLIAKIT
jgi:hypothetical protein